MIPKDANVLITGGGGFIFGWLTRHLVESGHNPHHIHVVDIKPVEQWFYHNPNCYTVDECDLRDQSEVRHVFAFGPYDYIFSGACSMGGMGYISANKLDCMKSVLINTNCLMEIERRIRTPLHEKPRYFYSSSACVYAAGKQTDPNLTALKESDAYPAEPEDGYGFEKLFTERMCRHFSEETLIETRVARFHNVYGPHGTFAGGREKAPAAICRKVIEAKLSGKHEIEIWGDGTQTRSFMYIDDCIRGIMDIMNGENSEPVNLGSSELVSINQLVDIVEEIAGVKLKRNYNLSAPKGVMGRNSDNTMFKKLYGWEPSIPLREGMKKTYDWIYGEMTK